MINLLYYLTVAVITTHVKRRKVEDCEASSSSSSRISTRDMELVVERLLCQQTRKSTSKTYLNIFRQFNTFVMSLDFMPDSWEHRATLFTAHLVEKGRQSSSIKSYMSVIKKMLIMDGYKWKDEEVLTSTLTDACKLIDNRINLWFAIHYSLLEVLLFEVGRMYEDK